jgi:hypothetical protein
MMTDERLQQLLDEAAKAYRVPPLPPLDAMWERIEHEAFDAPAAGSAGERGDGHGGQPLPRSAPWRRWLTPVVGIAATLLVGIGIGRYSATPGTGDQLADAAGPAAYEVVPVPDPLQRTTFDYLDAAEVLLASMPRDASGMNARFVTDARQLLTTTRLLLDSPLGEDPELRAVLEDLELVLAQMARLRPAPQAEELTFIAAAVDERDVVPRLRSVTAALTHSDY